MSAGAVLRKASLWILASPVFLYHQPVLFAVSYVAVLIMHTSLTSLNNFFCSCILYSGTSLEFVSPACKICFAPYACIAVLYISLIFFSKMYIFGVMCIYYTVYLTPSFECHQPI